MPTNLRFALWFLLLGIVSVTVYHTARDDREPLEEPAEPALEAPAPEQNTAATVEAPTFAQKQPPAPVGVPIALPHRSPQDPRDWSKALVIREKEETVLSTRARHRIVEERGFPHPIHIAQAVETDPASGEETAVLITVRVANQILLTSIGPIDRYEVADIADSLGWRILPRSPSPYLVVLETEEADFATVDQALEAIQASGTSLIAGPNQIYYASATPSDPRFAANSQWGLHQANDIDIDAPEGWDVRRSAPSIIVAIVDTGVRVTHEDLKGNVWTNPRDSTRDGRDDDGNGYIDDVNGIDTVNDDTLPHDDDGHGTHIAGIVGAVGNNGKGIAGVAWDVQLMAIKSLNADGRGTTSMLVEGIDYAIHNGARIINASWSSDSYDAAIDIAIQRARERGILFVAAAGNDGASYPSFPASLALDNVLSVGSISRLGELSRFSNYNKTAVHVLAPGEGIVSTWHEADDAYTTQEGTSTAAPYVSGILALNLAQHASDDHALQVQRLIASSDNKSHLRPYAQSEGIVNLAGSLKMIRVPVPPRIVSTSSSAEGLDEGSAAYFYVHAESEMELSYAWYHNGSRLSEASNSLTLENVQPYQRGQYLVEVANADATVSASFTLEVFPRMREIEALIGADVQVFASHEDHWELVQEEGATAIVNRELAEDISAQLRFISSQPGMLQFFGKKPNAPNDLTTTTLSGPNAWVHLTERNWSQWQTREDRAQGFQAILSHDSRFHDQATPSRSLFLRIPEFFATGRLPPLIQWHPQSHTTRIGETVSLSVGASGVDLRYQWYKNGVPLKDATQSVLQFLAESATDAGNYYVTVSNEFSSTTSNHAHIEIDLAPQPASLVFDGPSSLTFAAGDPLELSMKVFGSQPITYQWYKDEIPISGTASARLRLGPASIAHAGVYRLSVENDLNESPVFSPYIRVHVSEEKFPPRFLVADKVEKQLRLTEGLHNSLSVGFPAGSDPIELQWFKDGEPFQSGSQSIYFSPVTTEDAGIYYLEARNKAGLDQSGRIHLVVPPPIAEAIDNHELSFHPSGPPNNLLPTSQHEETWDGEDAVELYSDAQLGESSLTLRNLDKQRVISFRWKVEQGTAGTLEVPGLLDHPLVEQGTWNKEIVLLEPDTALLFKLVVDEGQGRAWLDAFEEVKAPYLQSDLAHSLPSADAEVILRAKIIGDGLTYQWYKDEVAITGANSSTFTIGRFAAKDAGSYRLAASNDHGSLLTSTVEVSLNSIEKVVSPPLAATASDNLKALLGQEHGETFLGFQLVENEVWSLETQATGPATLAISHALLGSNSKLTIDSEEHVIGTGRERNRQLFFIPPGKHTVTLSIQALYTSFPGKLYSMRITDSPLARVHKNIDQKLGEYGIPLAEFAGIEPLGVTWFHSGEAISTLSNTKSGQSILFAREPNGHDHGVYHIEVTDAHGKTSRSETYLLDLHHLAGHVLDYSDSLYVNSGMMEVDRMTKIEGTASLRFHAPFGNRRHPRIVMSFTAQYASLWLRSAGFPAGSEIRFLSEGNYISIPANGDWTPITADVVQGKLLLQLPDASEDSKVWLDNLAPIRRAKFVKQPSDVATYLGASVRLEALANEPSVADLKARWTKDGQPVTSDHASQLFIESVSIHDLGKYQATVVSPNGQVVKSRRATLSLLSTDLAAAIGYAGARITTIGNDPWKIDYADSVEGPSSIMSGALEPGESTTIEIDIDGPASWGLYSYYFNDSDPRHGNWRFAPAPPAPAGGTSQLSFSEYEFDEYGENDYNPRLRIDGLRLTRLSDLRYERWIDEKLASLAFSLAGNSRNRGADPDRDGLPNWLEFVLGLDPAAPSALPTTGIVPSDLGRHTASVELYAARSNEYSISYEASFDLASWFAVKPRLNLVNSTSDYDHIQATIDLQSSAQRAYFVRWKVEPRAENQTGAF